MMEYRHYQFPNNSGGQMAARRIIDRAAKYGWQLKGDQSDAGHFSFGRLLAFGIFFARDKGKVRITLEREVKPDNVNGPITGGQVFADRCRRLIIWQLRLITRALDWVHKKYFA